MGIIDFFTTQFPYVDASFGNIKQKWRRMSIAEVNKLIKLKKNQKEAYISIQHYPSSIRQEEDEVHMGMFAIDIDETKDKLQKALDDARKVFWFMKDTLEIETPWPRVFFSGSKGFHLEVHPAIFGITPTKHLPGLSKSAAGQIALRADVTSIDEKIYSKRRLFRLPNTINTKSGLYKVELDHHDFLNWSLEKIMKYAQGPQDIPLDVKEYLSVGIVPAAREFWNSIATMWKQKMEVQRFKPTAPIKVRTGEKYPVCISKLLEKGPPGPSMRNQCTMILLCFLKDQGVAQNDAGSICFEWLETHYDVNDDRHKERVSNTIAVTNTVYENPNYHHICSYVATTNYTDEKGVVNRIPCIGYQNCPYVAKESDQVPETVPEVSLSASESKMYHNMRIKVPVHVLSKFSPGYKIPEKVFVRCHQPKPKTDSSASEGDNNSAGSLCDSCPLNGVGLVEWEPDSSNREVLDIIEITDDMLKIKIKTFVGVPKRCPHAYIETQGGEILSRVEMAPIIQSHAVENRDSQGEYIIRDGYCVGEDIVPNTKYYAILRPVRGPKKQRNSHLIESVEPVKSSLDSFKPSIELLEQLRVFQVKPGQTVKEKINSIHDDLEVNITKAIGRRTMSIVMDMVWHSVLRFSFKGDPIKKGWLEALAFGDSGQGKNKVADALLAHYKSGDMVGGEGATRQGLAYSAQKKGDHFVAVWGRLAQSDRGLLIIDEMSGIPLSEFQKLTRVRSEGVVEAQGILSGHEANARTRLLFMSNPRPFGDHDNGVCMADYTYGIEAFKNLYPEPADRRRVDIAVGVKEGDIPLDLLLPDLDGAVDVISRPHIYTSSLCHNLILWAWTRTESHVRFTKEAEAECNKAAKRMAKKYSTKDISLVTAADQPEKIARVAAACAARVFSTDENYQKLYVDVEHVKFAEKLFSEAYDSPSMEYDVYAKKYMEATQVDGTRVLKVEELIRGTCKDNSVKYQFMLGYFTNQDVISIPDAEKVFNLDRDTLSRLMMTLLGESMIKRRSSGNFKKLPKFINILKQLSKDAMF